MEKTYKDTINCRLHSEEVKLYSEEHQIVFFAECASDFSDPKLQYR